MVSPPRMGNTGGGHGQLPDDKLKELTRVAATPREPTGVRDSICIRLLCYAPIIVKPYRAMVGITGDLQNYLTNSPPLEIISCYKSPTYPPGYEVEICRELCRNSQKFLF